MKARTSSAAPVQAIDLSERRLLCDTSWPLALIIMTASYLLSWSMGLLSVDLSSILWTTFGLAFGYMLLSRALDFVKSSGRALLLHGVLNVIAIVGLGIIWSMLGGLAAPAFAIFFALPVIALGIIARPPVQYGISIFAILVAWFVALSASPELRLQLEHIGIAPVWNALPGLPVQDIGRYGIAASGSAQLQFMLVFSFAILGVATTSAVVIAMIRHLCNRLTLENLTGQRADRLAHSLLAREGSKEVVLDRASRRIIAASPGLAEDLGASAVTIVGSHVSAVFPHTDDDPATKAIEAGLAVDLPEQVLPATRGHRLVNFRLRPGAVREHEFQHIVLEDLHAADYARIAVDAFGDLCGVVNGRGIVQYMSPGLQEFFPGTGLEQRADRLPLAPGWWEIAPRLRHVRHVSIGRSDYELYLSRREYYSGHGAFELTAFRLIPEKEV
jgi:PAS domain-containing protein